MTHVETSLHILLVIVVILETKITFLSVIHILRVILIFPFILFVIRKKLYIFLFKHTKHYSNIFHRSSTANIVQIVVHTKKNLFAILIKQKKLIKCTVFRRPFAYVSRKHFRPVALNKYFILFLNYLPPNKLLINVISDEIHRRP